MYCWYDQKQRLLGSGFSPLKIRLTLLTPYKILIGLRKGDNKLPPKGTGTFKAWRTNSVLMCITFIFGMLFASYRIVRSISYSIFLSLLEIIYPQLSHQDLLFWQLARWLNQATKDIWRKAAILLSIRGKSLEPKPECANDSD